LDLEHVQQAKCLFCKNCKQIQSHQEQTSKPWCTDHTFASVALVHVPHGEPYQGEADQGISEDS